MKSIRTKLVLSLLVITLLPVFPVYYLVKGLLQRGLEVGFNQNVETALQEATDVSRELYAIYRAEVLAFATEAAQSEWARQLIEQNALPAVISEKAKPLGTGKIDFFDSNGDVLYSGSTGASHRFPQIYKASIMPLILQQKADILRVSDGRRHVSAGAPIWVGRNLAGLLVVTKAINEEISQGSQHIVDVHQMFKTLNFFEGDLTQGFLLAFIVIYLPIAVLSVGLGYYFSRRVTNPLLSLVAGTRKVAAGDWNYRVQATSRDEVGQLVTAFNHMVASLEEKQDQVVALEKMATWREIARILAHEIKNPLTPIQLTVQQMKDKYSGEDDDYKKLLAECSNIVSEEIESLRRLVREFSDFARMPKLSVAPGDLNELVEEAIKLYQGRPVKLELDSALAEFEFDHEKLRRALINLIENGLDSLENRKDGALVVKTWWEHERVMLQVSDNGSGIPTDLQAKIFEPYFSTKKSGIGLGLAIVKRIVEEHGGRIALESGAGQGTTFTISLPHSNFALELRGHLPTASPGL